MSRFPQLLLTAAFVCALSLSAPLRLLDGKLHLRSGGEREWRYFPAASPGRTASIEFQSVSNATGYSLILRQRDVKKRTWVVDLNGRKLGTLQEDERSMVRILAVPVNVLRNGSNTLQITGEAEGSSDDIEITDVHVEPLPVERYLGQAIISVTATGDDTGMPVKLTIVDKEGALVPFAGLFPGAYEAQRTGVLYTPDGRARIGLPAGEYKIYASRGFEYSAPSERFVLRSGSTREIRMDLKREVKLTGYVSCDPHVHTLELSRHGDATVDERILTAAGEGLDIIVATEHNRVDDYTPAVNRRKLDRWMISIPGNEVTTAMGHFNIFPTRAGARQPDSREQSWSSLMRNIRNTEGVQVVVQNHPRDLHLQYRPFDPSHHLSSVGTNLNGRPVQANAMEVVNSGAMSSDVMQLVRDWMGLLTRGATVAAIGSSDTHTVDFVPIGQARTYIQVGLGPTGWRDGIPSVFQALAEGRNLVSYGLAAELRMTGEVRKAGKQILAPVEVTVHGPSWSTADHLEIYSNGHRVWQESFPPNVRGGVKYRKKLSVALPQHDASLVAVVTGPGVLQPFWEVRKPYQPMSDEWNPIVIGVSSAVRADGDGDGIHSAPLNYAERLAKQSGDDITQLAGLLANYDRAVALHALDLLRVRGVDVTSTSVGIVFRGATSVTKEAYDQYMAEVSQIRRIP